MRLQRNGLSGRRNAALRRLMGRKWCTVSESNQYLQRVILYLLVAPSVLFLSSHHAITTVVVFFRVIIAWTFPSVATGNFFASQTLFLLVLSLLSSSKAFAPESFSSDCSNRSVGSDDVPVESARV